MKKVMFGAVVILCSALCLVTSCGSNESGEQSAVPQKQADSQMKTEVVALFDGTNFDAWNMDKQDGWVIDGGTMSLGDGGSIWKKERYYLR